MSGHPVRRGELGSAQRSRVRRQKPAGLWVLCVEPLANFVSWEGGQEEIKEYGSVLRPPSRSLTLISFRAAGNVSLTTFSQVTCAEAAPVVLVLVPCDLLPCFLTISEEMRGGSGGARIP